MIFVCDLTLVGSAMNLMPPCSALKIDLDEHDEITGML